MLHPRSAHGDEGEAGQEHHPSPVGRRVEKLGNEHGVSSDLRMSFTDCIRDPAPQAHSPNEVNGAPSRACTDGTIPLAEPRCSISNPRRLGSRDVSRTSSRLEWLLIAILASVCLPVVTVQAAPPDPLPCTEAFYEVREWLDRGRFPRLDDDGSNIVIPDCSAVGVLLRLDGRVVGRGLDSESDSRAVRRAAGRALSQALGDRVIRELPESVRNSAGSRLTLEIEFAGRPEPIVASTLGSAATRIRPGIDGIILRRGDRTAIAMPGRLLATGTAEATGSTLLRLIDELGLPPRDLEELRRIDSLELARFPTIRIGQSDPSAEPGVRRRSGPVIPLVSLERQDLLDLHTRLNERLLRWRPAADPRDNVSNFEDRPWFGDFDPVSNRHIFLEAALRDRLLAIWALGRAGSKSIGPTDLSIPDAEYLDAEIADLGLLASLALGDQERTEAWLEVVERHPPEKKPVALARRAAAIIGVDEVLVSDEEALKAHLAAWQACGSVSEILAGFDWLAIAEARLADRLDGAPSQRATSLRAIRDALLTRQLPDGDDAGGIPLQANARQSIDGRNLRPMLAMAVLKGIPGEGQEGAARAQRGLTGLLRLLKQLMLSETEAADLAGGPQGLHGVADGLANPRQSLAATATASLVLDELIRGHQSRPAP